MRQAFHADLHIHSKYSRATSRDLDLERLAFWAARKGVAVVGTGDCVHPAWLAELKDKLVPDGRGLFRLKDQIEREIFKTLPPACRASVRFMLSTEISTIYKKGEKTRKIHHLIYAPDFDSADRLASSLARIGNIASDGRPILGLDSRDLLEIALQSGPDSYLVPAHIWTPWFAALGSQSGFDSIEECYGDLAGHIFAVETGLSSDPAMNWRISSLDRFRLTSNSDAHSPGKLGREATRFCCEPDYFAIRRALETGEGYVGTVEFFPEEGKYHLDGHRACGVRLEPTETLALGGRCPACGGKVTIGVAHRVETLADRSESEAAPPPTAGAVTSLTPLPEILSELLESGVASQSVTRAYDRVTATLGPELSILQEAPIEDVAQADPLLGEAVTRLRNGAVIREAGYDGEYGIIRLFEEAELRRRTKGGLLFDAPAPRRRMASAAAVKPRKPAPAEAAPAADPTPSSTSLGVLAGLDEDQRRAAAATDGAVIVLAGPGAGKTRVLTRRLAHLVLECGASAAACLAVTFTRRAAAELQERLAALIPAEAGQCAVHSFHALGLAILRADGGAIGLRPDFQVAEERRRAGALAREMQIPEAKAARLLKALSFSKRTGGMLTGADAEALAACRRIDAANNWIDFDDLIGLSTQLLTSDAGVAARWRERFRNICIDEFQDIDEQQYKLIRLLVGDHANLCAIGDPNQAIYGFRGADASCFERLAGDFPGASIFRLARNYRSSGAIVQASAQAIGASAAAGVMRPLGAPIAVHIAADERAEVEYVAATIESLLGGHDLLAAVRHGAGGAARPLSFADFAVLYRTDAQAAILREAFDEAGIPFKKSSPAAITGQPAVRAVLRALDRQEDHSVPLMKRIDAAAEQVGAEGKEFDAADLAEARRWLAALACGDDEARLREQVALSNEADFYDRRAERVSLLTMHAAKGLEFAVVFVVGLEDGLTPFSWSASRGDAREDDDGRDSAAEERRLFYVAMTRAKERLFLTRAAQRFWRGQIRALPPSPYLAAIAADLIASDLLPRRTKRTAPKQYSLF
ncbi:MAG TPA: UvrD-helicase domain-containing protein [Roseiarcus sp.]|nr:UvrD-helicase domain-containing protein [Roseiarcus sp.]